MRRFRSSDPPKASGPQNERKLPGLGVYQTLPAADMKVEVAAVVGRSGWNGAATTFNPDGTVKEPSTERIGLASGMPSFEGRVKLIAKTFEVFVAGQRY